MKINANHIAEIAKLVDNNKINRTTAKNIIGKIIKTGELPSKLINEKEVTIITDEQILNETINKIFEEGKNAVVDTKKNSNAINFLLGKVMMATRGRADPKITMKLIKQKLEQI